MPDDGVAEFGQGCAAAVLAACLRGDDGSAEAPVQIVDQKPGAAVRHAHPAARLGNRAVRVDQLQQLDLARPDRATRIEIDAQCEPRHGPASPQFSPTLARQAKRGMTSEANNSWVSRSLR